MSVAWGEGKGREQDGRSAHLFPDGTVRAAFALELAQHWEYPAEGYFLVRARCTKECFVARHIFSQERLKWKKVGLRGYRRWIGLHEMVDESMRTCDRFARLRMSVKLKDREFSRDFN